MNKLCNKCLTEKDISLFNKHKGGKFGVRGDCMECRKSYTKSYRILNSEKEKLRHSLYWESNKSILNEKSNRWYQENKEWIQNKRYIYKLNNKEKVKLQLAKAGKTWRNKNKGYTKNRRNKDLLFRLKCNLTSRINRFYKYAKLNKTTSSSDLLGIDILNFRNYIASKFKDGMNFSNYGRMGWHIDHIIPLSSAKSEKDVIALCHYTNLQPLWWYENLQKSGTNKKR